MTYQFDAKTIDQLRELGKLTGTEKTIVSNSQDTKKVSIDTIAGYIMSLLTSQPSSVSYSSTSSGGNIIVISEGDEIPVEERIPGCFYLEQTKQTSIRSNVSTPVSVSVSSTLGLKRM